MIGVFDSGLGALTILEALVRHCPRLAFAYLADHAEGPYGDRATGDVIALTRTGVETLFRRGCRLVLIGCDTAACVATRTLQKDWLAVSGWPGHNVLGVVAPTVEAATQVAWGTTAPPSAPGEGCKESAQTIAVFGTTRTIASHAYPEEIRKRRPRAAVVQQTCPDLAEAVERGAPGPVLDALVGEAVGRLLAQTGRAPPHQAILGCTHYPLVETLFRRHLPAPTRLLSQPGAVARSLANYLERHPRYVDGQAGTAVPPPLLLTSGDPARTTAAARVLWPQAPAFRHLAV